jgi:MFS family permease
MKVKTNPFALLKHRGFALLWFGQTISRIGNMVYDVALGYAVYMLTKSSLSISGVLSTFTIAQLISLLFGGVIVDRFSRKRIIIGTDIVACAVICCCDVHPSGRFFIFH